MSDAPSADALDHPSANVRAARGGVVRLTGYAAGTVLATVGAIVLLRYLGVRNYGRYATVISLGAIVTGLTDAGLTLVGQREYVQAPDQLTRKAIVGDILGIRLAITPVLVALTVLFTWVAGYGSTLSTGCLVVGFGVVVSNVSLSLTTPLAAELRFGAITVIEVVRQLGMVIGNVLIVELGGSLAGTFWVPAGASAVALGALARTLDWRSVGTPRPHWRRWRRLLAEAGPMAVALIVAALYLRVLLILTSIEAGPVQAGLFAASNRVTEVLVGAAGFITGAAFPLMSRRALQRDLRPLGRLVQGSVEVSTLLLVPIILGLIAGAGPVMLIVGGHHFTGSVPVLRLQALSLIGSMLSATWTTTLIAIRRQKALITINLSALVSVLVLGFMLIPSQGAQGAAIAGIVGESLIACLAWRLTNRADARLRTNARFLRRLTPAIVLGGAVAVMPGIGPVPRAIGSMLVYGVTVALSGAVPESARLLLSRTSR